MPHLTSQWNQTCFREVVCALMSGKRRKSDGARSSNPRKPISSIVVFAVWLGALSWCRITRSIGTYGHFFCIFNDCDGVFQSPTQNLMITTQEQDCLDVVGWRHFSSKVLPIALWIFPYYLTSGRDILLTLKQNNVMTWSQHNIHLR